MDLSQAREHVSRVDIPAGHATLEGELAFPPDPTGLVLFVHGSGSSRHSPRNRHVARSLRTRARVGTLLFDLLTETEEAHDLASGELRFDIPFLARRVEFATRWSLCLPRPRPLPIGYFGASTGAAAALLAASDPRADVAAVVSRGGRPDLVATHDLARVRAPTLFLVGGDDYAVLELNRGARNAMTAEARVDIVPRAGHLFEEPGALEEVARRAAEWFRRWLGR
jgi:pimeloyl-ACP methyl ester carboxylesterase